MTILKYRRGPRAAAALHGAEVAAELHLCDAGKFPLNYVIMRSLLLLHIFFS